MQPHAERLREQLQQTPHHLQVSSSAVACRTVATWVGRRPAALAGFISSPAVPRLSSPKAPLFHRLHRPLARALLDQQPRRLAAPPPALKRVGFSTRQRRRKAAERRQPNTPCTSALAVPAVAPKIHSCCCSGCLCWGFLPPQCGLAPRAARRSPAAASRPSRGGTVKIRCVRGLLTPVPSLQCLPRKQHSTRQRHRAEGWAGFSQRVR